MAMDGLRRAWLRACAGGEPGAGVGVGAAWLQVGGSFL
ncbi:hypothetical protein S1OALGB6SA_1039 [Olavius algarvensis spirochete endosymbiont]|nr:hypothetical protein S1OALGB6SA_1039 [Olavius algarvensis spirochete endosymbiont]